MEQGLEVPASETPEKRRQGLPAPPTESYSAGTEEDANSREWDNRLGKGMAVVSKQGCGHPLTPNARCLSPLMYLLAPLALRALDPFIGRWHT